MSENKNKLSQDIIDAIKANPLLDADSMIKSLETAINVPNPTNICPQFETTDNTEESARTTTTTDDTESTAKTDSGCKPRFQTDKEIQEQVSKGVDKATDTIVQNQESFESKKFENKLTEPIAIDNTIPAPKEDSTDNCKPRFPSDDQIKALANVDIKKATEIANVALANTKIGSDGCEQDGLQKIRDASDKSRIDQNIAAAEFNKIPEYLKNYYFNVALFEYYLYVTIIYARKFPKTKDEFRYFISNIKVAIDEIRADIINKEDLDDKALVYLTSENKNKTISDVVKRSTSINKFFSFLSITYETFTLDKLDIYERDIDNLKFDPDDLNGDAQRLNINNNTDGYTFKDLLGLITDGNIVAHGGIATFQSGFGFITNDIPPNTTAGGTNTTGKSSGLTEVGTVTISPIIGSYDQEGNATAVTTDINKLALFNQFVVKVNTITNTVLNTVSNALTAKMKALAKNVDVTNKIAETNLTIKPNVKEGIVHDFIVPGFVDTGSISANIEIMNKKPTIEEAATGKFVEILFSRIEKDTTGQLFGSSNQLNIEMISIARIASVVLREGTDFTSFFAKMNEVKDRLIESKNLLVNAYNINETSYLKYQLIKRLREIKICDKPILNEPIDTEIPIVVEDLDNKNYPPPNSPEFKDLKYWLKWCQFMNIITLQPQYYPIGLLIPNPSGITRVPLPMIWIPIAATNTPTMMIVVFITICGQVISPVIWVMKFLPLADNESSFFVLPRDINQLIKNKTETKSTNMFVKKGIDVDPNKTKIEPFVSEDLPAITRMSIKNILWLTYLDKWVSKAKDSSGYP